jgi:hypothetical protein
MIGFILLNAFSTEKLDNLKVSVDEFEEQLKLISFLF